MYGGKEQIKIVLRIDKDMQMSKSCLDEAFEMTEEYWGDEDK